MGVGGTITRAKYREFSQGTNRNSETVRVNHLKGGKTRVTKSSSEWLKGWRKYS